MGTTLICKLTDCMHNTEGRCWCTAIGIDEEGCDSYMHLDNIKTESKIKKVEKPSFEEMNTPMDI